MWLVIIYPCLNFYCLLVKEVPGLYMQNINNLDYKTRMPTCPLGSSATAWPTLGSGSVGLYNNRACHPGSWFNIKMVFPGMGISIIKIRPSYLYDGNANTGKTTSLYWGRTLVDITGTIILMPLSLIPVSVINLQIRQWQISSMGARSSNDLQSLGDMARYQVSSSSNGHQVTYPIEITNLVRHLYTRLVSANRNQASKS